MTEWPEIACQRGHREHVRRLVTVDLSVRHQYHDLSALPAHLVPPPFQMYVYPPERYPVDNGPLYCPCHDAVSATIVAEGIWEPVETILALQVLRSGDWGLVDFGAQIGWFSLLALACGSTAVAYDADAENVMTLRRSAAANGWEGPLSAEHCRFGPDEEPMGVGARLVKIDVEGAEADVVAMIYDSLVEGTVDHLLIEVSPSFGDGYPELVASIADAGYAVYTLPDKATPPVDLSAPPTVMETYRVPDSLLALTVESRRQQMLWFRREGATW